MKSEISNQRCPSCDSPSPHLHPAVQFEGEVETCSDEYHLRITNRNKPEYIKAVLRKRGLQEHQDEK